MFLEVTTALGLLGLLSLIPFFLFYLIKPKPMIMEVPAIKFFLKRGKAFKKYDFLEKLKVDWLFWLQLFVLVLLSLSLAGLIFIHKGDVASENMVFVLDVSASSQVMEGSHSRFDISVDKARELAGRSNYLILARDKPFVALSGVDRNELVNFLKFLRPTDEESALGDSIVIAGEILGEKRGRVVVFSDFANTKGLGVDTARNVLKSRGLDVQFVNVGGPNKKNVGIVDLKVDEESTNIYIGNFNDKPASVVVDVNGNREETTVGANSIGPYVFETLSGIMEVKLEISGGDDLEADNHAFISSPIGDKLKVLYITSNASRFMSSGLSAWRLVKLDVAEPPVLPGKDYDVYVIGELDKSKLLPGTFKDISERVRVGGKSVVITSFRGFDSIDYSNMLPVDAGKFWGNGSAGVDIVVNQVNKFTRELDFGVLEGYYKAEKRGGITILSANDGGENNGLSTPIVVMSKFGSGNVVYYGFIDDKSDFKLKADYPVFWARLLKFLANKRDVSESNLKTGTIVNVNGKDKILENIGLYELNGNKVAVNIMSSGESELNVNDNLELKRAVDFELEPVVENIKSNLGSLLLILVILVLLFEFVYIRIRGDG